jgi:phosphate transport system permease protein
MRTFFKNGSALIWLTTLATGLSFLMIGALLVLIMINGLGIFWPSTLEEFTLKGGGKVLGEVWEEEESPATVAGPSAKRLRLKIGNRDFYGLDFRWIEEENILARTQPAEALVLERQAWGNAYGYLTEIKIGEEIKAVGAQESAHRLPEYLAQAQALHEKIITLEKEGIGEVNYKIEQRQLALKRAAESSAKQKLEAEIAGLQEEYHRLESELEELRGHGQAYTATFQTVDERSKTVALMEVVRAYQPNTMSWQEKAGLYAAHLWEFLSAKPREANTEGGVLPAIFGTVLMVMLMSLIVVPFGVLAAIYIREYAKAGPFVRIVRIAVNNLAGVPSIVFGIFGLGFFIYAIGGTIDQLFYSETLPAPTFGTGGILWASLTLALLTVPVVIVTTEEGLAAVPRSMREASLALGATKVETLWRVVLPSASPAILTGLILAMARAAGEVAPLMITGVVKLAPSLPLDGNFPYLHLERKFMHLGFHIYDVGFQSPNVEAALPMVYATTLLLILIVLGLNLTAILLRNRLHRRFSLGQL